MHPILVKHPRMAREVNAFYSTIDNQVYLLGGILQAPLIGPDLPSLVNFAGMGAIIGHEMFHGFDSDSHRLAGDLSLRQIPWTGEEEAHLQIGFQCIRDSFRDLTVNGTHPTKFEVSPVRVQAEAFADSHGVQASYIAWKSAETARPYRMTIPGFEHFQPEQLFWMLYSSMWCGVDSPKIAESLVLDVHPPNEFRNWKAVTDTEGWHEAFGCPKKKKLCRVYGSGS